MYKTGELSKLANLCSYAAGSFCQASISHCLADLHTNLYRLEKLEKNLVSPNYDSHPEVKPSDSCTKADDNEPSATMFTAVEKSIEHSP